jgi:hypothetical protein
MDRIRSEEVHLVLVDAVPEFRDPLESHLQDNSGEVLPHVLFGDLTRFVLAARREDRQDVVVRALTFLETALAEGDREVKELVAVSFVENIGPWDPSMAEFVETWPSGLQAEAVRQRRWTS